MPEKKKKEAVQKHAGITKAGAKTVVGWVLRFDVNGPSELKTKRNSVSVMQTSAALFCGGHSSAHLFAVFPIRKTT